jgi:hypothetical protein
MDDDEADLNSSSSGSCSPDSGDFDDDENVYDDVELLAIHETLNCLNSTRYIDMARLRHQENASLFKVSSLT